MLARLGIRQKLSLLLLIPLAAVVLVMVPFTAERIDDARTAGTTARTALAAREIGGLIQTLQQERLLVLGYLSAPSLERSALVALSQTARDEAARLRLDPNTADVMRAAAPQLDTLIGIRQAVVSRTISARFAYDAFRDANTALLDALRLNNAPGADAQGLGQLGALDALMRSNEEASSVGAILVAAAADPNLSRTLLTDAVTADQQHLRRFRELVPADEAALVDTVENGKAGQRIRQLILTVSRSEDPTTPAEVSEALTAAVSYTGLRRLAQDRIAREIASGAQARAGAAEATAYGVAGGAVLLFIIVVSLGFTVSRSISRPLRRLTRAAAVVAELSRAELIRVSDSDSPDPTPPQLAAVEVDSADEIGELAAALNRVQATAALLLERQVTTRRNVSVMFANIARRTQNLVGRQLALIEDLERNERNPELLQRLYRLDHVATRLRRSADSLLVVSGTIDQLMSGGPTPLADVIRSALAEIEGYQAVEIGEICDVAVAANLVADLRLLLAELLENATNFSPPGTPIEISAALGEECHIRIVDHGVGMGAVRLAEENRRLVERERLDVAPTTVLGLFVVGRLARRHGLTVLLEHSEGRGITVAIRVPVRLLSLAPVLAQPLVPARLRPERPLEIEAEEVDFESGEPFEWFSPPGELIAIAAPVTVAPAAVAPAEEVASNAAAVGRASVPDVDPTLAPLPRRTVSAQPDIAVQRDVPTASDAVGESAVLLRAGLIRRVPGTHMVDAVRDLPDEEPTERIVRDPEAERAALNDYLSGLALGDGSAAQPEQPSRSTLAERHS